MSILIYFLLSIHVLVSLLIILVVLMQRPKSEGIGAAFGGGMMNEIAGAQTTNVLQKATRWLGGIFFVLTLVLSMLYSRQARANNQTKIQQELANAPAARAPLDPSMAPLVNEQPKPGDIVVPVDGNMSPEDLVKLMKKKKAEQEAAASGSAAATTGSQGGLNLQLQSGTSTGTNPSPKDPLESQKFQLQPSGPKKDGL